MPLSQPRISLLLVAALLLAAAAAGAPTVSHAHGPETTHRVAMTGNRFLPALIQARPGDTIAFVNGNGGPHNAAFWPDSLPAGGREFLAASLPDTIGPLVGPLLFAPDQRWTIVLAGVPAGRYPYYCLPHVAGGMVGAIEVRGTP